MSFQNLFTPLNSLLVVAGVFVVVGAFVLTIYVAERNVSAQTAGTPRPAAPKPTAPAPQPPAAQTGEAVPAGSVRTETITYDAWTVSCRDTVGGKSKKVCSATLPMTVQQQNQRINIGAWIIAHNDEGALLSVVQTPQIDIGVLIARGVELKLGDGKPHRINYVLCNPRRCESTMPMDDATIRELIAAANAPAAITFWKGDGAEFSINIQSIKGIDKAIAAIR